MPNRIKWRHAPLSAKQVNNEDLDHQLGPQTLTALLTPLELIDPGFHAGSARLGGMINCRAQSPSYHPGPFVKVSLYSEKLHVSADLRPCSPAFTFVFGFVHHRSIIIQYVPGTKKEKRQYDGVLCV